MLSKTKQLLIVSITLTSLAGAFVWAQTKRPVPKRAKVPNFSSKDTEGIYFQDVFTDALSGSRPADLGTPKKIVANPTDNGNSSANAGSGTGWSQFISAQTLEDEIKRIKLKVDQDVTTPAKFAGRGYKLCRKHFSMLAMSFGIIGDYNGTVRWQDDAPAARDLFARTAGNCKVGTQQVYNEAKLRKEDLAEILRGSGLNAAKEAEAKPNWGEVVDRSPLMQRLETAHQGALLPYTANKAEFNNHKEDILHEAEIIAAIGEVLVHDSMDDGDDDDYASYSDRMKQAALEVVNAVKTGNDEAARKAAGEISKSCTECHELYRG